MLHKTACQISTNMINIKIAFL